MATSTRSPIDCQARKFYELTRTTSAFNVPAKLENANQYCKIYRFPDGSRFIVYYPWSGFAYRGTDGVMYARRTCNA